MKPTQLKAHVKAEKAALIKGGAPKKVMDQERAEYAKEGVGFACGGKVHRANGGIVKLGGLTSKGKAC